MPALAQHTLLYKAGPGGAFLTDNADSAHSYGIEADFHYRMTENVKISRAAGLIEAEYDDYDAGRDVNYDEEYIDILQYSPTTTLAYFGSPRTVGLGAVYHF